ncbi:MFS transporter [Peribacillus sp. SCS-155]|uniref:MFS transporter n=1 Tax=Peribacillus sedimenti TaxID=3115297 RepID=UPI0039067A68
MLHSFQEEKIYQRLFMAGLVNGIGDRFSQVALLTLLLQLTGSGLTVGITLALRMLPFLLFGPFSSYLARKYTRKYLLMVTDAVRAVVALSFMFVRSPDDFWVVYIGTFLLAAGEALYAPVRKASIPAIIHSRNIKEVNSWEQVQTGFVLIFGALAGGLVSFLFGTQAAFAVNILSFFISALFIRSIPSLDSPQTNEEDNRKGMNKEAFFPYVIASSFVLIMVAFETIVPLINGIENVLLSVYAVETFHAGDLGVGILYSVLGTGFIISPLITKWITGKFLMFGFICLSMEGVILSLISQTHSFMAVVTLFGILTIFGAVGNTLTDTAVMNNIPSKWLSSYFALTATISNTGIGVSMFLTGLLLESVKPRAMGLFGGLLYLSSGCVFLILHGILHFFNKNAVLAGHK